MNGADFEQKGLTPAEVVRSREEHGSNQLTHKKRNSFLRQFLSNFGDPIIKVLLVALAVNLIFLFHHFDWYESAGIAIAIFLATFVSTLSEYGSESAFSKLQEDAARLTCRVRRREGLQALPVADVVVGDIVLLQAGERVPADGILLSGRVFVDQAALNGETKEAEKLPGGDGTDPRDLLAGNRLFRGSVVCSGEGVLLVQKVGDSTFYGGLAQEIQEETRESPLKVRLAGLAKTISKLGYAAAAVVAVADLFHAFYIDSGMNWARMAQVFASPAAVFGHVLHALTLAITVVVVAVPEGLPMMITVVLSSNMRRMLKDHVLVRKLVGIETSGSLNILFTDKTGTLTKGRLEVGNFLTGSGEAYRKAADLKRKKGLWDWVERSCSLNSESLTAAGKALGGNATDRALLDYVLPLAPGREEAKGRHVPFDSARKFSALELPGRRLTLVKGAPEKLLDACNRYVDDTGAFRPLGSTHLLRAKWQEMTKQAMRVLALAISETAVTEQGEFSRLILVGLVGIRDEIRPEARASVEQVRGADVYKRQVYQGAGVRASEKDHNRT